MMLVDLIDGWLQCELEQKVHLVLDELLSESTDAQKECDNRMPRLDRGMQQ